MRIKLALMGLGPILAVQILGCAVAEQTGSSQGRPVKGDLDRPGAARLISNSAGFKETKYLNVHALGGNCEVVLQKLAFPDPARRFAGDPEAKVLLALEQAGLVTLATHRATSILSADACWPTLTEAGKREAAQWKTISEPTATTCGSWAIPIGDKGLVEITGITGADKDVAIADYTFEWVPTPLCAKLDPILIPFGMHCVPPRPVKEQGKAAFKKYDDGWRLASLNVVE